MLKVLEQELEAKLDLADVGRDLVEAELGIIRCTILELAQIDAERRRVGFVLGGGGVACDGGMFLRPSLDVAGEPVYDPGVVSGRCSYRWRLELAARVYGPRLQVRGLAAAVFATGDTGSTTWGNVAGNLRAVARHGVRSRWRWLVDDGWLVCQGVVEPDFNLVETLRA